MRLVRWSVAVLSLASLSATAEVKLPHVFGDHMVLQREQPIPVWGWAAPGEKVSVRIDDAAPVSATANDKGAWRVDLPAMSAGGPHKLTVAGSNTIVFDDVLDTVKTEVVSRNGSEAKVRINYTLLGQPLSFETDLVEVDGRWYGKQTVEELAKVGATPAPAAAG